MELLRSLEVKKAYTDAEKLDLLRQISEVNDTIIEKNLQLENYKEATKTLKEQIEGQYSDMQTIIAKYKQGYELKIYQCSVKYLDGMATFTDSETGEIVQSRPITEQEQLAMSEARVDAETVIRQARAEEDAEDNEE